MAQVVEKSKTVQSFAKAPKNSAAISPNKSQSNIINIQDIRAKRRLEGQQGLQVGNENPQTCAAKIPVKSNSWIDKIRNSKVLDNMFRSIAA